MAKTPDEIKKGLEHCSSKKPCPDCPMWDECKGELGLKALLGYALAYIQQLEESKERQEQNLSDEYRKALNVIGTERDAAVADLDTLRKFTKELSARNEELHKEKLTLLLRGPRWISVEERLPETQEYVLLFVKHDSGGTRYLAIGCRAHWTPNRYYIKGAISSSIDADRVTHWMPLPQPPKEDEKT